MKIVCRNYRQTSRDKPWLVRDEAQLPHNARAFAKVIVAGNVMFSPADLFESEQGYSTVIMADTAAGIDRIPDQPGLARLYVAPNGSCFRKLTGEAVSRCTLLYLDSDGGAFAVLHNECPAPLDELLTEGCLLPAMSYSPTQRDDHELGSVSNLVVQLAALRLQVGHQLCQAQLSLLTSAGSESRRELLERSEMLQLKLRLVDALFQYCLHAELGHWQNSNVTLRRGGKAVVTARDNAQHREQTGQIHRQLNEVAERLAGGQPIDDNFSPNLPPELEAIARQFMAGHI